MQIKSKKETTIKREVNCTINPMENKQVKQSTPLYTLDAFRGAKTNKWETHFSGEE